MKTFDLLKEHQISPRILHSALVNNWNIPDLIPHTALKQYFLLYWTPEHFDSRLQYGTLTRCNTEYLVVYHKCNPWELRKESQVALSFREPLPGFHIPNYVLVKKGN